MKKLLFRVAAVLVSVLLAEGARAELPVSGAAFHFDASVASTFETETINGTNFVKKWKDASDSTRYASSDAGKRPWLDTLNGLPFVDFGPGGYVGKTTAPTGFLKWSSTDSSIREVFLVYSDYPGKSGSFLLSAKNSYQFHRGGLKLFNTTYADTRITGGLIQVDGETVAATYELPEGFHIIHLRTTNVVTADRFASDRDGYMQGAQRLREVVIYNKTISNDEAAQVHDYLHTKWWARAGSEFEIDSTKPGIGSPMPAYGIQYDVAAGAQITCSVPQAWTNAASDVAATCTGWKLYDSYGELKDSGSGHSLNYVHPNPAEYRKLVWQWNVEYKISTAMQGSGTLSNKGGWVSDGTTFESTATGTGGQAFRKWTDSSGKVISTEALLSQTVTTSETYCAFFSAPKAYVSTNVAKLAVFPYATSDTAAHTLQEALTAGTEEIEVGEGTYVNTESTYTIDRAVRIVSEKGPEKTILKAKSTANQLVNITHDGVVLAGFTLRDGRGHHQAKPVTPAINISAGTLSNCWIKGTLAAGYSKFCYLYGTAKVLNCDFDGSSFNYGPTDSTTAFVWMEGNALVDRCKIHNCNYSFGFYNSDYKCTIILNAAGATLRNSLVCDNINGPSWGAGKANYFGGGARLNNGTIENCTFSGNTSSHYGGGIAAPTANGKIVNCIVWGNTSRNGKSNDIWAPKLPSANITYCCSGAVDDTFSVSNGVGVGCTAFNPQLKAEAPGKYQLTTKSVSCIDQAGVTAASQVAGATDLAGNPRLDWKKSLLDIGCYEFVPSEDPVPLTVTFDVTVPSGYGDRTVRFVATPVGDNREGLSYCWHFGDGQFDTQSLTTSHLYKPGLYEVSLAITNSIGEATNVVYGTKILIVPNKTYVAKTGLGIYPYDTWEKATNDLSVVLAAGGYEVIVADGVYTNTVYEHVISREVYLHSVNGPAKTTLKRIMSKSNGRHFTISSSKALVSGFTLDSGHGGFNTYCWFSASAGVISNCVVKGTFGNYYGCYCELSGSGKAVDCEFDASSNGNVYIATDGSCYLLSIAGSAVADRCVFHGYHAYTYTSGSWHNRSAVYVNGGTLRNSLVYDCSLGAGTVGTLFNGGGVRVDSGNVVNCTVTGCTSWGNGGGIYISGNAGYVRNSIAWGNVAKGDAGQDVYAGGCKAQNVSYTCASDVDDTTAIPAAAQGAGCIAANPLFRNVAKRDYRIKTASPCIDAGDPDTYPATTGLYDLSRLPRLERHAVDMGCYESQLGGLTVIVR